MPPATRRRAQPQPSPPHHFIDPASDSDESDDEGVDDEELIEDVEGEDEEEDEEEEEPLGRWAPLVPLVAETLICHFPHPHMTRLLHSRFIPLSASVLCQFMFPITMSICQYPLSELLPGIAWIIEGWVCSGFCPNTTRIFQCPTPVTCILLHDSSMSGKRKHPASLSLPFQRVGT